MVFPHLRVLARSRFLRPLFSLAFMSRSDQLQHLAAQLASMASLDTVACGIQSLLVPPPGNRGSIFLSKGGSPTGLAVKCSPQTPPGRTRTSRIPLLPCPRSLWIPRAPSALPHPRLAVRQFAPARRRAGSSDAAECRRRSRDKRARKLAKCCCAPTQSSHPRCCPDSRSLMSLLWVALCCRIALDIWTITKQDYSFADQDSSACSGSLVLMSLDPPCQLVSLSGCALSSFSPASRSPTTVSTL